jgi:hypothetical protein
MAATEKAPSDCHSRPTSAVHILLLENAARAFEESCFGFRLGSEIELTEARSVFLCGPNFPNLAAALRNLCRCLVILIEKTAGSLRNKVN